jgi:hypothetical protein
LLIAMGTPRSEELALAAATCFREAVLEHWRRHAAFLRRDAAARAADCQQLGLQWLGASSTNRASRRALSDRIPAFIFSMVCLLFSKHNRKASR